MNDMSNAPAPPRAGDQPVGDKSRGDEPVYTAGRESIAGLLRRLIDEISALIRMELRLARSELQASVTSATSGVAAIAVGGLLAVSAVTCLLIATIVWLADHIGLLAAVLSVAGVLTVAAIVLIVVGISRLKHVDLVPKRVTANLKRDANALKGD